MRRILRILARVAPASLLFAAAAVPAAAQSLPGSGAGAESLQPYHFLFLAYALAWVLVFGWVVSVARRLARLEKRLKD